MVDERRNVTLGSIAGAGLIGDTKGWVMNLELDDGYATDLGVPHPFQFWFRPEPVREAISVNYNKMSVLGMSHEYQAYANTTSIPIEFELYVNRLMLLKDGVVGDNKPPQQGETTQDATGERLAALSRDIENGRRYLEALTVPPQMPIGVVGGAPPVCLLVLPGILELRVRLTGLQITFSEVDLIGNITEMRARCTFEEAPLGRFTMQDVLERGTFRTWGLL